MRIVFTGGGTGGHLYPIVAVAREIKRIAEAERILDIEMFYFGPETVFPSVMREENIVFSHIASGKIRRYFSLQNGVDVARVVFGILEALWKLFVVMPDVVFAKGGYGSFPTLVAARIYRIPVVVHASDAIPGLVERWAGTWARRIAIAFPTAASRFPKERTAIVGIPVRGRILGGERSAAQETFGVFSNRPVIFVTGASQGAAAINHAVIQILKELTSRYEVIHQSGEKNLEDVRLETAPVIQGGSEPYYHLLGFLSENEMRGAYALADLVIARASATTIFETAANVKPAILIPLQNAAQDHQKRNAYAYAATGAAVVVEEGNLTPSLLLNEIDTLMADPARRATMAEAARAFARLDAGELIAREILGLGLHEHA